MELLQPVVWKCSWCDRPTGHDPQSDELYVCPSCGTKGMVTNGLEEYSRQLYKEAERRVSEYLDSILAIAKL